MGVASIIGKHILSQELDCEWATIDVDIHFEVLPPEESTPFGAFEILKVVTHVTGVGEVALNGFNQSYIEELVRDEIDGADYHWSDHGD